MASVLVAHITDTLHTKAHVSVDITGCNPDEALHKVRDALTPARLGNRSEAPDPALQDACPDPICTVES